MCWERGVCACWDIPFLIEESIHPLHSDNHQEWERAKNQMRGTLDTLVSSKLEDKKLQCLEDEPELQIG